MLPECIVQALGQLKKKEAFQKGPLVRCLLGLGTTAAAYVEEPEYRMCSEYSVRGRVCVYLTSVEEGLPGASVEGI